MNANPPEAGSAVPPVFSSVTTSLLSLDERVLPAQRPQHSLDDYFLELLQTPGIMPGDVLFSRLGDDADLDTVARVVTGDDHAIHRSATVTDIYRCAFGDRLLAAIGAGPAHHTQLRRFELEGVSILQLALYPRPPSSHGVRLWCDPPLLWMFVLGDERDRHRLERLRALQPAWERVRVHHGPPLDRPQEPRLAARYPVEDPLTPISAAEQQELSEAVDMLVGQRCVQSLIAGDITPRQAVDSTLRGRRSLSRHLDRLDKVLEHSHGPAETKVELLAETAQSVLTHTSEADREHLLAPYQHQVLGLKETHLQVKAAVDGASTTTALISSAAVGRLLDRSEANRRATTAIAVAAFSIAILTSFSALAALPRDDRQIGDLVRLGGWVGTGGVVLISAAYLLARVSALPAGAAPSTVRRLAPAFTVAGATAALGLFLAGGLFGHLALVLGASGLALATAFLRAWTDDY